MAAVGRNAGECPDYVRHLARGIRLLHLGRWLSTEPGVVGIRRGRRPQRREYPWGSTDPGTANEYAIYECYYPPCRRWAWQPGLQRRTSVRAGYRASGHADPGSGPLGSARSGGQRLPVDAGLGRRLLRTVHGLRGHLFGGCGTGRRGRNQGHRRRRLLGSFVRLEPLEPRGWSKQRRGQTAGGSAARGRREATARR